MTDVELQEWLKRMVAGDRTAFEVIYEATYNDVFRTVSFLVSNKQDILQDETRQELISAFKNYRIS